MNGLTKTAIGTLIVVLFGLFIPNLGALLLIVVVCTAGLGIIPVLIAGFIVGSIVDAIINQAKRDKNTEVLSHAKESMVLYVKEAKKKGLDEKVIKTRLKNKGWKEEEINEVLKSD